MSKRQLGQRLLVARALGQHLAPQPPRLVRVTARCRERRQVAAGEVPVDPFVDAAKLIGPLERQDPPPRPFGLGPFVALGVDDRLAKPQFRVVRIEPQTDRARQKRLLARAPGRCLMLASAIIGPDARRLWRPTVFRAAGAPTSERRPPTTLCPRKRDGSRAQNRRGHQ
jgi:hypothetical protein